MWFRNILNKRKTEEEVKESLRLSRKVERSGSVDAIVKEMRELLQLPGASIDGIEFKSPDGEIVKFKTPDELEDYFNKKNELDLDSISDEPGMISTVYGDARKRNTDRCPYCGIKFDVPPTRARKCSKCGEKFYVRVNNRLFSSDLLREGEVCASDCFRDMMSFGVSVDYAKKLKDELKKKWGQEPNPRDVVWNICRFFPLTKEGDAIDLVDTATNLKFQIARYELACGRDPKENLKSFIAQNIAQCELHKAIEGDKSEYIYIESQHCCEVCRSRHGKQIKIKDALEKKPLPFKDCQNKINPKDKFYFCNARYTWYKPID